MKKQKEFNYFDKRENIRRLWIALYAICGLTLIPDFFVQRHGYIGIEGFFGFYSILGFGSCAALILLSKVLGRVLKVRESYYDN